MSRHIRATLTMIALALVACRGNATPSAQQLQTVTVTRGNITATTAAAGNVAAKAQVTVPFQATGQIQTVNVKVGDRVKAGQVMAALETTDLEAAVTSAQAAVQVAQAKLVQTQQGPLASQVKAAQASVASAAAALQVAQAKANHLGDQIIIDQNNLGNASQTLSDAQGAYSNLLEYQQSGARGRGAPYVPPAGQEWSAQKANLDNATVDYNVAQANYQLDLANVNDSGVQSAAASLAQAQAQLKTLQETPTSPDLALAQLAVQQAQVSLEQAQSSLRKAQLIAPIDGIVADVNMQVGQQTAAVTSPVILVDISQLLVNVTVAESDIPNVKVGQTVQVTLDALPNQTYPGHVIEVALAGTTTQGVVNYPVTIVLDQPGTEIPVRAGMSANVAIVTQERDNVLLIPNRAIRTSGRNRVVTVLANGKETTVNVTVGLSNDTESEVTSGLNEGDVVVVPQTTTTSRGVPGGGGFGGPGGFGR